jgi:hypothetical protein
VGILLVAKGAHLGAVLGELRPLALLSSDDEEEEVAPSVVEV